MSEWIKCSERMPAGCKTVLACQSRNKLIRTAYWLNGIWKTGESPMDYIAEVTHWQPLPEPPK